MKIDTSKDARLQVGVEGDCLVIRVGIDTLKFCQERSRVFFDYDKHGVSDGPYVDINDQLQFAHDMSAALKHEEEDGTTPVHLLLDNAALYAFEQGGLSFGNN